MKNFVAFMKTRIGTVASNTSTEIFNNNTILCVNKALEFEIFNRKVDDRYSCAIILRVSLHC